MDQATLGNELALGDGGDEVGLELDGGGGVAGLQCGVGGVDEGPVRQAEQNAALDGSR